MKDKNNRDSGFFTTLSSLQFGITVLIAIALVSIIGTIIPQGQSYEFYKEHFGGLVNFFIDIFAFNNIYGAPLFLGLLGLLAVNLILCSLVRFPSRLKSIINPKTKFTLTETASMPVTLKLKNTTLNETGNTFKNHGFPLKKTSEDCLYGEKGRAGYLGPFFVHLSIIILLIGGLLGNITGKKGYIVLNEGETTSLFEQYDGSKVPLGFSLTLEKFSVEFYDTVQMRPKSFKSSITVNEPDGNKYSKDILVNHPLMINGLTIFQSSYGTNEKTNSSLSDTAQVEIRINGASLDLPPILTLDMTPGVEHHVPGFGDSLKIKVSEVHRDFKRIQTVSEGTNPAVKIEIYANGIPKWSVYTFKNYPGVNMPMAPDLPIIFVMLGIKEGTDESGDGGYYSVLGAVKDKGLKIMWLGVIFMIIGLFLSFYVRPRRIAVVRDDSGVIIGASSKGNTGSMKIFIEKIFKKVEKNT